ncbi:hypothetical protein [Dyadobacter luticola]|uniref:Uncharacterized protein n=1 Tax=Dyadobacter luticola TaxID=1979387 RepID=A0A5R9KZ21_9BACT|nr:hypothetical protein [Dyadobacter luticola]TLV01523.1 hypothetical protein FEN17_19045 [Dyadobacter luticola]
MRFFSILALGFLILQGCKKTNVTPDPPLPEPTIEIPQTVKELIYKAYPTAGELKNARELEKDKVYEVSFRMGEKDYSVISSQSNILQSSRMSGEEVPESVVERVQKLSIKGGVLSNYRTVTIANGGEADVADYLLNGFKYVARFTPYAVYLNPFEKDYYTKNTADLPEGVQQFIAQRNKPNPTFINTLTNLNEASRNFIIKNNELTFSDCRVLVMPDGTNAYEVSVNYFGTTHLTISFNADSKVNWVASFNRLKKFEQDFNGTPALWAPNLTTQEISYFRDVLAGSSHFLGFNLDNFLNFERSYRNEYEDVKCYELQLNNNKNEFWYLRFSADKKLIYSFYNSNY